MTRISVGTLAGLMLAAAIPNAAQAQPEKGPGFTVTNPTETDWENAPVVLPAKDGKKWMSAQPDSGALIAVQSDDLDGDGKVDELVFPVALKAGESKHFTLTDKATRMAPQPTAHTGMYTKTPERRGFEGPGWESDLVAFRLYWDERNASDVFAKTTPTLSMENLARTDVDYHHPTPWGMDVLKVKTAVGIGGFGAWINGKVEKVSTATRNFVVRADGPYRAVCDLVYTDWQAGDRKLELTARMKICGGQDFADCDLIAKATDGKPLPDLLCGFVKHEEETTRIEDPKVAMVGRWGNQALGPGEKPKGGNLGMAVMADPAEVAQITGDDVNELIILKPAEKVSYRYMVDWYKDVHPATSAADFENLMRDTAAKKPVVKMD